MDFSKIEAFIFDNDGVLVNSEPLSGAALRKLFLEEYDIDIGTDFSPVIGSSDISAMTYYMKEHQLPIPKEFDNLIKKKSDYYFEMAANNLSSFPLLHELLDTVMKQFNLAIASSGNHDKIQFSIKEVGISQYFQIICSATEVSKGKPAPDLFLFTAECLGIPPERCVVVEDSVKGIMGAKAANMYAIGFTSTFDANDLRNAGADVVISSFRELQEKITTNR